MESTAKIAIFRWEPGNVPRGLEILETLKGNSTNPDSYPFPVRFCPIEGACLETVLENPSQAVLAQMIECGKKLTEEGVRAISTSCGFNAVFQRELASALDIPVFTSSLLQVPYMRNVLHSEKTIGIITAKKSALTRVHFDSVGITDDMNVAVFGMEKMREWSKIFTHPQEEIDIDTVANEVVTCALDAMAATPSIGAFVLECTDLPPFSDAIRMATGKPVVDFISMMRDIAWAVGVMNLQEDKGE